MLFSASSVIAFRSLNGERVRSSTPPPSCELSKILSASCTRKLHLFSVTTSHRTDRKRCKSILEIGYGL